MILYSHLKIFEERVLMNYYERIQRSIEYIETNIENEIDLNHAAREAFMSQSNYYRMFFALVGFTVKEYIRHRRISLAASELHSSDSKVMDIAIKYDFESQDSFSRAFKRITGFLPSQFRQNQSAYSFERVSVMDKYFEIQDSGLIEKYPDIKVLKKLEPVRVAYYCYYGTNPEHQAFSVVSEWLKKSGLDMEKDGLRIFGYNNPDPATPTQEEYGYEICVTINDTVQVNDEIVKTKVLEGGLYAVSAVKRGLNGDVGEEIMKAWQRFKNWIQDSKYIYGGHQYLEEHLGFDDDFNHVGGVDLYMPIMERSEVDNTKTFVDVEPMWTASYIVTGDSAIEKGREFLLNWAKDRGLFDDDKVHRFFGYYNHERMGQKDFFYKIHVTVDKDFVTNDDNIQLEQFNGGHYAVMKAQYRYLGGAWSEFINWISRSTKYSFGDWWFFEEYMIDKPVIEMDTEIELHMPVKLKE